MRASECDTIIRVLNAGVDGISKDNGGLVGGDDGVVELLRMADVMDRVAGETEAMPITTEPLRQYTRDYQKMCRDVARAARLMASAVESRDEEAIGEAQAAIEEAGRPESSLVLGINGVCTGGA